MSVTGGVQIHPRDVLPFPGSPRRRASLSRDLLGLEKKGKHVSLMNPKREARLWGAPDAAPKREARILDDPKREARLWDPGPPPGKGKHVSLMRKRGWENLGPCRSRWISSTCLHSGPIPVM